MDSAQISSSCMVLYSCFENLNTLILRSHTYSKLLFSLFHWARICLFISGSVIQSDLHTTRLYSTWASVIRGFFSEIWYPQLFRVFEPNCRRYFGIANMSPCEKVTLQSYNDRMMSVISVFIIYSEITPNPGPANSGP